ncbi:hypothetical protein [Prauserella flavalba]|uniref:Uncharacterized protein n=1 Tax=Prauserella flavalba TaxID=1477506 RepID=A0A318LCX1_9PSEU|nr:hypothetical protein [Prauserella flavalba]PXY18286.1 hypothetical protein BA062_36225 [Prauserella flavalba]
MNSTHADFYLGPGPDARWLGSLAEFDGRADGPPPTASAEDGLSAVFAAEDIDTYQAAVVGLLAHRAAEGGFAVVPGPDGAPGWPWRAATSIGWYACTFHDGQVRLSWRGGPWTTPDLSRLTQDESAAGPPAELPVLGATEPPTARFTYTFRGHQIPITQRMRPTPQTYLDHRAEAATAVAGAAELVVRRRWPLPDLAATAVREIAHGLLRPGPGPNLSVLPDDAPFAYERLVAALHFLIDADRYAENNNPDHGLTLLTSAADVAAQAVTAHRTSQPYPWPQPGHRTKGS